MNRLKQYIVRDKEEELQVQKIKIVTKVERITEKEHKKSFLKNQPNTKWVFVIISGSNKEARYQIRDQMSQILKQRKVEIGEQSTTVDTGLRAIREAARETAKNRTKKNKNFIVRIHTDNKDITKELTKINRPKTSKKETAALRGLY